MIGLIRKAFAMRPPRALRLRLLRWMAGSALREFPLAIALGPLAAIALAVWLGALESPLGIALVVLLAAAVLVLARFAWQALGSARSVREALAELEPPADEHRSRFPRSHLLLPPLMFWPRGVRRVRGVEFARYGSRPLRLDVFMPAGPPPDEPRPAIVQVHGGGWIAGTRNEQGIPLLNHLANHGWVGFNVDYRLSPRATFPEHLIDVKRAIAWVREHGAEYGADPSFVCITGGSAGGHLCALAALSADDLSLQPGFEDADTSVAAAVPFYGIYDLTDSEGIYYPELREWVFERNVFKARYDDDPELFRAASPTHRVHAGAPPFLVIHGERDTLVPVADARRFVDELRAASENPVLYAELAAAEHAFDIVPSVRTARVVGDDRALPGHGARRRFECRAVGGDRLGSRPQPERRRAVDVSALKNTPLFADVPEEALTKVATFATLESAVEGKTIIREGGFSNDFYVIEDGTVKVEREGEHVADLGPGDVFGEQGLLEKQARSATVTATSPVRLIKIEHWELSRMKQAMPDVVEQLRHKVEERTS